MSIQALQDRFKRQLAKLQSHQNRDDEDLAALANCVLAESAARDDIPRRIYYSDLETRERDQMTTEALILLRLLSARKVGAAKTLRVVLDALLCGWVRTHDRKLEERVAKALLGLPKLEQKEESDQLGAALRDASSHMNYDTDRILRLLALASSDSCEAVVHWAFWTFGSKAHFGQLSFATACLQACGLRDGATELQEAARHHIETAARTLEAAKKLRFTDKRGGPYKPHNETIRLLTATQVDYSWCTSNMGEAEGVATKSAIAADQWLDWAELQVLDALGPASQRGFGVDLLVGIYPHVENWPARTKTLKPITTVSRSV